MGLIFTLKETANQSPIFTCTVPTRQLKPISNQCLQKSAQTVPEKSYTILDHQGILIYDAIYCVSKK